MRIINLREAAYCTDCGAYLAAGVRARYYGKDRIYCETHDHARDDQGVARRYAGPALPAPQAPQGDAPPGSKGARVPESERSASTSPDGADIEELIGEIRELQDRVAELVRVVKDIL